MCSISKWYVLRKDKKKNKEKEAKMKKNQEISQKKREEEIGKVENFIDENIHEAFDTLKIYQKCLEDERKRWVRNKKNMTPETCSAMVTKLRKIYGITKQNMDLLDTALVQGFIDQFPEESPDRLKPAKISIFKPKFSKTSPVKSSPGSTKPSPSGSNGTGGNKRKMKNTSKDGAAKKPKQPGTSFILINSGVCTIYSTILLIFPPMPITNFFSFFPCFCLNSSHFIPLLPSFLLFLS